MKPAVLAAFLTLVAFSSIAVPAQQPAKATIEGIVVNAITGEPVQGARVMLSAGGGAARPGVAELIMAALASNGPPNLPMLIGGGSNPSVTTQADGKFSFSVDPGTYRVAADSNGFAPGEFGQRSATGAGTALHPEPGQTLASLTVRLTPTGVVSGRIADDAGMPADQAPVQVLRVAYNKFGQRLMEVGAYGITNDRGEFRLYGITPGRYYLNIGGIMTPPAGSGGSVAVRISDASSQAYASSYYPGVTDLSRAVLLEVKPGVELNADMRVTRETRYRVRGRVTDSQTGKPPTSGSVSLSYRTPSGGSSGTGRSPDRVTGVFEFYSVIPGTYMLQASAPDEASLTRQLALRLADELATELATPKGELPITLTGDLDNLVLTIFPPGVLEGRLTVNGEPPSSVPNLDRVRLGLWPSDSGGVFPLGPSAQVPSEGTFRFDKVPAATYKFGITGLPASFYVEKAELNGVDMLSDAVTFSSSSGILNVALQRGTGAIRGTVADAQSRAAIGVEVVLVPEQRRRLDLYKTAITDKSGRFTMAEIPPGNYRLFSWEAIDPYGYYDPAVLSRDEARSVPVRVSPSSNNTVDVRIIPVEP